jgi:hypothetical protein
MKSAFVAALGAAVLVGFGAGSSARADTINFGFGAFDGSITHTGSSLDTSDSLDVDQAFLLVMELGPADMSGLAVRDLVALSPANIIYGFGSGTVGAPISNGPILLSWTATTGSHIGDMFTEKLTTVNSIDRETSGISSAITVELSGTVSDTDHIFPGSPILLVLHANQDLGQTIPPVVTFTNTSSIAPAIPETSTWVMMVLGFGAIGYAASGRRKMYIATLSA